MVAIGLMIGSIILLLTQGTAAYTGLVLPVVFTVIGGSLLLTGVLITNNNKNSRRQEKIEHQLIKLVYKAEKKDNKKESK